MTKYRTVNIPDELIEQIKKELIENNDLAYRSHSEFIIDAARRRLEKIRKTRTR